MFTKTNISKPALNVALKIRPNNCCSFSARSSAFTDYSSAKKDFTFPQLSKFNFVKDFFQKWAKQTPNAVALWWTSDAGGNRKYTFSELEEISSRIANGLEIACGLQRGDRIVVILPRVPEWWVLNLASIRLGLVFSPGTTLLTEKDIRSRLLASQAKCIIVSDEKIHIIEKLSEEYPDLKKICVTKKNCPDGWYDLESLLRKGSGFHKCADTDSNESMMLFFTSGTTGTPKMAEHSHASYGLGHMITGKFWLDLTNKDVMWANADTGWAKSAYSMVFAPWLLGSCVFTHQTSSFDPTATLRILEKFPISTFCTVPTAYRSLIQENLQAYKFKSLIHTVSAGEPLNPEVTESWKTGTDLTLYEGYGQTETVLSIGSFKCIENRPGSMGKASPGFDVKVIDDDGYELDENKEGNLAISVYPKRPLGLFKGYADDEERTEKVFLKNYYITGDRAYCDKDGYFWFVGRSDDVIKSSGYRIGPFEVESALIEHPAVVESAVVSSPDKLRGEVVKAFIVLTKEAKEKDKASLIVDIQNHVKSVTAPYKYPRKIEFVDRLPKTVSGKIRRVELRQMEWAEQKSWNGN